VRHVREVELEVAEIVLDATEAFVELFDLVADAFHRVDLCRCVLLVLLEARDFLRRDVPLVLERLGLDDDAASFRIELEESVEVDVDAAFFQRFAILVCVLAEVLTRQHGAR
jgi:hypothetical protein